MIPLSEALLIHSAKLGTRKLSNQFLDNEHYELVLDSDVNMVRITSRQGTPDEIMIPMSNVKCIKPKPPEAKAKKEAK